MRWICCKHMIKETYFWMAISIGIFYYLELFYVFVYYLTRKTACVHKIHILYIVCWNPKANYITNKDTCGSERMIDCVGALKVSIKAAPYHLLLQHSFPDFDSFANMYRVFVTHFMIPWNEKVLNNLTSLFHKLSFIFKIYHSYNSDNIISPVTNPS